MGRDQRSYLIAQSTWDYPYKTYPSHNVRIVEICGGLRPGLDSGGGIGNEARVLGVLTVNLVSMDYLA